MRHRSGGPDNGGPDSGGIVPEFEIVLWGYDRRQVRQCLEDLTARLEQALSQIDSLEVLQAQLCEAHVEVDQLRRAAEDQPSAADRLSKIMLVAEQLRRRATRDAEAVRAGRDTGAGRLATVSSGE